MAYLHSFNSSSICLSSSLRISISCCWSRLTDWRASITSGAFSVLISVDCNSSLEDQDVHCRLDREKTDVSYFKWTMGRTVVLRNWIAFSSSQILYRVISWNSDSRSESWNASVNHVRCSWSYFRYCWFSLCCSCSQQSRSIFSSACSRMAWLSFCSFDTRIWWVTMTGKQSNDLPRCRAWDPMRFRSLIASRIAS